MKRATLIVISSLLATAASPVVAVAPASQAQGQDARQCSADAQPQAERQAMEARFREIDRREGRAAAMAYAQRLIADGVCTADGRPRAQARAEDRDTRQGSNCRLETRPVAGFGGAPMTMGMVTVCD